MKAGGGFRRFLRRSKPAPLLDPPGYRLPGRVPPPAPHLPPIVPPPPAPPPVAPVGAGAGPRKPKVRLVMADGSVAELPVDPELEERAAYLVRSMLPPPPPPPAPPSRAGG